MKKKPKNEPKQRLAPEECKDRQISMRATAFQVKHITGLAQKCDMSRSEYLVSRAFNYEPKARLTNLEFEKLDNLENCRVDLVNFVHAMQGMDRDKRKVFFNNFPFLAKWANEVNEIAYKVSEYLYGTGTLNSIPPTIESLWKNQNQK